MDYGTGVLMESRQVGASQRGLSTPDAGVAPNALSDLLSEFAGTMVTDFPIQGILDHLVRRIVEIMPISSAGVTLIAPGLEPRYIAASDEAALRYEKLQTALGEGPCLAAYRTGKAITVADLCTEDRFRRFTPPAVTAGLRAVFTFPLFHRDQRLGALDLYSDEAGMLSEASMTAAQTLANVAAAYLINAQARSDLQDSSDQSRDAALHDALTGLPNRVLILQLLEHAFRRSRRSGRNSAVFFVDLDRFKQVNDSHGHQVGDQLLVMVAHRLTAILRPGDTLARLAGDEFLVLCEELDDPSQADAISARIHTSLELPFALSIGHVSVTASVGVAFSSEGVESVEDLLHEADREMYRAKRVRIGGRDPGDVRELHLAGYQAGLARGLAGAAERGELHIDYQPMVRSVNGHVTGIEALLRWTHPSRGEIPPSTFIPLAEQSGEIMEIGQWVLGQAWSDRADWQPQLSDVGVSVNVSANQFMSGGFPEMVAAVIDGASGDPGLLTLEITESVFLRDEDRALIVLAELKEVGVRLALDDFGTGYSSLRYLNTLPIDTIKVDQSFVAKLNGYSSNQTVVSAIVQLAHSLGMTVVSEGVETAEQHDELTDLGSDCCQGFYFASPMPVQGLRALLSRQTSGGIPRLRNI